MRQFEAATKALLAAGYVPVGMDHFALPDTPLGRASAAGALNRNFQGYTTDRAEVLLGFGASAIGMLPQGYVQNTPDVRAWEQAIEAGDAAGLPRHRDRRRRPAAPRRHRAADVRHGGRFRCHRRGSGGPGQDWTAEIAALRQLEADGLVDLDGTAFRVRPESRPLVRVVASVFDRYLEAADRPETPRHAIAV